MFAAKAAECRDRKIALVLAFCSKLFFDERLDRQAVAVVTGNIRSLETHHRTGLYDEVF